jgi:hypothetical protein
MMIITSGPHLFVLAAAKRQQAAPVDLQEEKRFAGKERLDSRQNE